MTARRMSLGRRGLAQFSHALLSTNLHACLPPCVLNPFICPPGCRAGVGSSIVSGRWSRFGLGRDPPPPPPLRAISGQLFPAPLRFSFLLGRRRKRPQFIHDPRRPSFLPSLRRPPPPCRHRPPFLSPPPLTTQPYGFSSSAAIPSIRRWLHSLSHRVFRLIQGCCRGTRT